MRRTTLPELVEGRLSKGGLTSAQVHQPCISFPYNPRVDTLPDPQQLIERYAPRIYEIVMLVPRGRVTTYGSIAQIIGDAACDARLVGSAMAQVTSDDVPWQRVVNAKGMISNRGERGMQKQRQALEAEGVTFDARGGIDLQRFGWRGPDREWAVQRGYHTLPQLDEPEQPSLFGS